MIAAAAAAAVAAAAAHPEPWRGGRLAGPRHPGERSDYREQL